MRQGWGWYETSRRAMRDQEIEGKKVIEAMNEKIEGQGQAGSTSVAQRGTVEEHWGMRRVPQ